MATKTRTKPLTFDAVDEYLRTTTPDQIAAGTNLRLCGRTVAARLGTVPRPGRSGPVADRTIDHWRRDGLDVWQADRIATALGMSPDDARLWGKVWSDAVDAEVERMAGETP